MLDAARSIALERGARTVTVDAIAALSGASVGSLYNRFGSRDKILTAAWQRALERFQEPFLDQLRRDDLNDAALGAARWIMEFARTQPEDARLLAAFRPADVLTDPNAPAAWRLAGGNAAIRDALRRLAERTGGGERAANCCHWPSSISPAAQFADACSMEHRFLRTSKPTSWPLSSPYLTALRSAEHGRFAGLVRAHQPIPW
ncbi:hypothetical protein LAUMK13_03357 [Mycobacterium innocens]|uniref:HTH tetR-type domain-containing protein n=2 Tax=Mycobacterium innocens TaxID=2341083 RepID=A0A498Q4B3_9MYCO|nr:hypothetical protein LAUMK13_03357 [Mycobacterium innocens]